MKIKYRSKENQNIKKFRTMIGLKEYVAKTRVCLKCNKNFKSTDIGNRICSGCTDTVIKDSSGIDIHKVWVE